MDIHANAIAARMSLREPQRRSLDILGRITEILPLRKGADVKAALDALRADFPDITDFERDFPSVCFSLATGVGKTRLMGAFIAYLHLAHGLNNFFVLAPNLTVYDKLVADFTPNTPKYVLKGISQFAVLPPTITTGENYQRQIASGSSLLPTTINIFNISKINAEVRGGRSPRIRTFREEIGESYFDYLASLDDLVLIMDESHRYRASAGIRAINELKPVLGLELTATPFVEGRGGPIRFQNIVFDYPLARAMEDGFVKEPAVVTREGFLPAGKSPETLEHIKLFDGIRLHESVKADLAIYAQETGAPLVKPFMLVIARDTRHAADLLARVQSPDFFEGRYADKTIQVDSTTREDEIIARLLKVEQPDEPTEIVIHVNMLKEGWDVTNLYTIVPLRAANARTLIEQSIGRGLRLPYGKRTGVPSIDRLNIVAHDRFQEILNDARRPDASIRLGQFFLADHDHDVRMATVLSRPLLHQWLDGAMRPKTGGAVSRAEQQSGFIQQDQNLAALAYKAIRALEAQPDRLPCVSHLLNGRTQDDLANSVRAAISPVSEMGGGPDRARILSVVGTVAAMMVEQNIDIPRILVVPQGVKSAFRAFTLDLSHLHYEVPNEVLWATHLRTGEVDLIGTTHPVDQQRSMEDHIVNGLLKFDDIAYEDDPQMLYDLAGQLVRHLLSLHSEDDARQIVTLHASEIAHIVRAQMLDHVVIEAATTNKIMVTRGFTALRDRAFSMPEGQSVLDFRLSPTDKSNMARYLFGGFSRCLYGEEKFQSDAERILAIILDREALKWFRPARGQFDLYYRAGGQQLEYQPDFVAETVDRILMLEPKAANQMTSPDVIAKRDAALVWCHHASDHASHHGGKPWTYVLIPHDTIAENMTLEALVRRFGRNRHGV